MQGKKTFLGAVEVTKKLLNDVIFMCESRVKPTYFTRTGNKLDFKSMILFSLYFVKKSIQLELDNFFELLNPSDGSITKQAYSEARRKISPSAFITLTRAVIQWFYDDHSYKTFYGYRLCAVDGSLFELNNKKDLRNHFGYVENKTITYARARVSSIYDIENNLILTSKIAHYKSSERDLAMDTIEDLKRLGLKNDLLLFDRGYPSRDFIAYLEENNIKYLMRAPKRSMKEINDALEEDQVIKIAVKNQILPTRVLRFLLESGEEEILVTNLIDERFSIVEFKNLYFKRWGIEVKYGVLKNKLQIENFTGNTPIAVEQDFYASIYLINMVALLENEANESIHNRERGKPIKYKYKVNTNIVIGKLKDSLILLLMEENPKVRQRMFQRLIQEILKNKTPIRPGRSYSRNTRLKANKFTYNQKRCL